MSDNIVDTGLKMSYYMDALTTDELTFYAGEEDAEESDLIDRLKDKSHPEYRYDNIEKAETVFLKIPKPEKGYTITVTVNGKSLSPMKELPENVSADYDYFKIKVTDKTDVSVKQEYVHFAILGIKINTTSSTYNFTCSKKLFAKLAGITYSIDGGIEQLIPDFDGDVKTYFIREKIPATAERLMIYAVPEDGAYRVTYHPAKIVAIRAEEGKQVPVTMQVTVEDPAGSAEESTYELNFIVEEKEPPRQVEVPAVQGKTFGKAKSVLEAAGLEFRVITEPTDDKRQDDIVIFSNPDAGEEVDPGSTVTVVVWEYKALPTPHPAPTREPTPKPTAPPTATPSETPWAAPAGHPAETLRAAPAE